MPEPQAQPDAQHVKLIARRALVTGVIVMMLKFGVFFLTNSAAVLSDAVESIINLIAAAMLMYSVWLANRPTDADHTYGHGKIEFMAVGLEGLLILSAGAFIGFESVRRLFNPPTLDETKLHVGAWMLGGVAVIAAILATYVWRNGKRYRNAALIADGKHLATDVLSTLGGIAGLVLVQWTREPRIDPLFALILTAVVLYTSWTLLWESIHGLMDRSDPADVATIQQILESEVASGAIKGFHKVRHRRSGTFHWVDMHIQVDASMTVTAAHELASRIEYRIEQTLHPGNATAHVEPFGVPTPAQQSPDQA